MTARRLAHHLIMNAPDGLPANAYPTTGGRARNGPYLYRIPQTDPWGNSFLVNVRNADPTQEGPTQKWVIVISAGPDGQLDTASDLELLDYPSVADDDIIANVK